MKRIAYLFAALGTVLLGSCASMTTEGEHGGQTMPWASPEGFEASGAGTPFGAMGGLQGR